MGKKYPFAWKRANEFRAGRGKGLPSWPEWCFLPLAASVAIVTQDIQNPLELLGASLNISRVGALAAWRMTKGIYKFDPDVLESLKTTTLDDNIPNEIFFKLPEWCVYCETPGMTWMGSPLHGMWTHLEWDANTKRQELRFLLDTDLGLIPAILHLGPWTLSEGIERATNEAKLHGFLIPGAIEEQMNYSKTAAIQPLVSMVLYLCSQAGEITDRSESDKAPGNPVAKSVKGGQQVFPKERATTWDVGIRMGSALRMSKLDEVKQFLHGDATNRVHIRRAHWHMFRYGPMKDSYGTLIPASLRQYHLKWIHPILVNADTTDEALPATIRHVSK
jgi:hypothetical protein